ncbi:oxidoreductase [Robbsia andropogonis]|uniref:oxidoreductase n=1 Tax=Robbsia andropogonis TaxID=28092 RepID=UPI003D22971C
MATAIRVGVVSYGAASKVFHIPLIRTTPGLVLAAVSSSDASKVRADYPSSEVRVFEDHQHLIASDDVDLVVLPTPNTTHYPLALAALRAGKHVVVDKPFTTSLQEAQDLARTAREMGRLLTVFHNRRWDADFLAVRALLDAGTLGRVIDFQSTMHYFRPTVRDRWREQAGTGGGLWNDLGPHMVDQALLLFGAPLGIYLDSAAFREGAQTDDYFRATLRYADKRVLLQANASAGLAVPRFLVQGSAGSYCKFGIDGQEDALKAGQLPDAKTSYWGVDRDDGTVHVHADGSKRPYPTPPGNYPAFYIAVRDALVLHRQVGDGAAAALVALARAVDGSSAASGVANGSAVPGAPVPFAGVVSLDEALRVMAVLDLGRESVSRRAEMLYEAPHA